MVYLLSLFIFFQSWGYDETAAFNTEATSTVGEEDWETSPKSPFASCAKKSCSNRQCRYTTAVEGHAKVRTLQRAIPKKDFRGNKSVDFFKGLADKIVESAEENLKLTQGISRCFAKAFNDHDSQECQDTRAWAVRPNPQTKADDQDKQSLWYQAKMARAHLAIASGHLAPGNILSPNQNLRVFGGYKTVPWQPLTTEESKNAQQHLQRYLNQFSDKKNLNPTQTEKIRRGLDEESGRKLSQKFFQQMKMAREDHLQNYRYIMSQYPILNYITSADPQPTEIYSAARKMEANAQKELDRLREIKKSLESSQNDEVPTKALTLLDYTGLVEDFLGSHQEHCAVATSSSLVRGEREMGEALAEAGPLLIASFLAPPLTAMILAGAASVAYVGVSYKNYKDQEQAVLSQPMDAGNGRANLDSLEAAQGQLRTDIVTVPQDMALSAVLSGGVRSGKLKKMKKMNDIKLRKMKLENPEIPEDVAP